MTTIGSEIRKNKDYVIPIGAEVRCEDGVCGHSLLVLINPVTQEVTHVVVKEESAPHLAYIVPVEKIAAATTEGIELCLTPEHLHNMEPFVHTDYITGPLPDRYGSGMGFGYGPGGTAFWPYREIDRSVRVPVTHDAIPPGKLAVRRGTRVEATDGLVGHVNEYAVDAVSCYITHLVMREGHLWGQKEVTIPVSAIRETRENTVYLNIARDQVAALPTVPLRRQRPQQG